MTATKAAQAFVKSFGTKYGFPPSQAAHTVLRAQTLLYADALSNTRRSFNPCAVGEALEGFEFDGLGNGPTLYRADDHQCFKDVLVVRGKENPTSEFDLLEIVEVTPACIRLTYPTDHPMFAWRRSLGDLQPRRLRPIGKRLGAQLRPACILPTPDHQDQHGFSARPGHSQRPHDKPGGDLMDAIFCKFLNGLDKGSAYALIALGTDAYFWHAGVVNFAHGALFMIGAFCAVTY